MTRRQTVNRTGIDRLTSVPGHDIWVAYTCVSCGHTNFINVGTEMLNGKELAEEAEWECDHCGFVHAISSDLPETWTNWSEELRSADSLSCERFWRTFFQLTVENKAAYWKQCKCCGRILPSSNFAGHNGWKGLALQLECRACKASINAIGNPRRTSEQHREAAAKRRIGNLLAKIAEGQDEKLSIDDLFERFDSKCFKTGKPLDKNDTKSWHIDHILPSKYYYPLTRENAALLSSEANENKKAKWPSTFYTPQQLVKLSEITGANLELMSSEEPVYNQDIDVDMAVEKYLTVRNNTNLPKRIQELQKFIVDNQLTDRLSDANKKRLGL